MQGAKFIVLLKGRLDVVDNIVNIFGEYENSPEVVKIDLSKLGVLLKGETNEMGGITAVCGGNEIMCGYPRDVIVDFIQSCNEENMSYLVFKPKQDIKGIYSMCTGIDTISSNFSQIEKQNADFYHMLTCSGDSSQIVLSNELYNILV